MQITNLSNFVLRSTYFPQPPRPFHLHVRYGFRFISSSSFYFHPPWLVVYVGTVLRAHGNNVSNLLTSVTTWFPMKTVIRWVVRFTTSETFWKCSFHFINVGIIMDNWGLLLRLFGCRSFLNCRLQSQRRLSQQLALNCATPQTTYEPLMYSFFAINSELASLC